MAAKERQLTGRLLAVVARRELLPAPRMPARRTVCMRLPAPSAYAAFPLAATGGGGAESTTGEQLTRWRPTPR